MAARRGMFFIVTLNLFKFSLNFSFKYFNPFLYYKSVSMLREQKKKRFTNYCHYQDNNMIS